MTSSDPPPPGPPPPGPEPAAPPPRILAQGHLHPGILFLRFVMALRGTILPLLIGFFVLGEGTGLVIVGVMVFFLLLSMGHALIRYVTFKYQLTPEELVTTEGIFNRQERRIPVNRIQDLSFEQTLVRRIVGLVVVTVETASGDGAEARLDSLGLRDAARLRETLQYIRSTASPDPSRVPRRRTAGGSSGEPDSTADVPHAPPAAPVPEMLFKVSAGELTLRGLTDNRVGAILIGVGVVFQMADEFGVTSFLGDFVKSVFERLQGLSVEMAVVLVVAGLLMIVVAGWVASIGASFLLFFDFTLVRQGEVFQRRYGLLTTRVRSLPRQKIQRVLLEQNLLRRLLRVVVMRADSAGSGANQKQEVKGGLDIVAPLTRLQRGWSLLPCLLPGMDTSSSLIWQRVSPRLIWRLFAQASVLAALGLAVGLPTVGPLALLVMLLPALALLVGVLSYHNLAHVHTEGHFAMRWGVLSRNRAFIPLRKVQAVVLTASPLDRLFGLARLSVYVAGAGPTTLVNLTRADAQSLQRRLALVAARSRFVW